MVGVGITCSSDSPRSEVSGSLNVGVRNAHTLGSVDFLVAGLAGERTAHDAAFQISE